MQVRALKKYRQSFIDLSRKVQSEREGDKLVHILQLKRSKLAQLIDSKVKSSKVTFQRFCLVLRDTSFNFDCWEECVDVQQEMKTVDLLDCKLLDL